MDRRLLGLVVVMVALLSSCTVAATQASTPPVTGSSAAASASGAASTGLPQPSPGWRWVSSGDAAVQVPSAWPHHWHVGVDWCDYGDGVPMQPYVATWDNAENQLAQCGAVPQQFQVMQVSFRARAERTIGNLAGHEQVAKVGHEWVAVTWRTESDRAMADRILATAQVVKGSFEGCPVDRAPAASCDLGAGAVARVSVCQYATSLTAQGWPALLAARQVTGDAASNLLSAVSDGEPLPTPQAASVPACRPVSPSREFVVAVIGHRSDGTEATVIVHHQQCPPVVVTAQGTHPLGLALCRAVFAEPPVVLGLDDTRTVRTSCEPKG